MIFSSKLKGLWDEKAEMKFLKIGRGDRMDLAPPALAPSLALRAASQKSLPAIFVEPATA
jgi:hypothetical protein